MTNTNTAPTKGAITKAHTAVLTADTPEAVLAAAWTLGAAMGAAELDAVRGTTNAARSFGDAVDRFYVVTKGAEAVSDRAWSDVRKVCFTGLTGTATWAGKSEATVQRAWKVARYLPTADAIDAWIAEGDRVRALRDDAVAAAKVDGTDDAAKAEAKRLTDVAASLAYEGKSIKSAVAYGDALAGKRINADLSITPGSNRTASPEVTDRNLAVTDGAGIVADIITGTADDDALGTMIVPGVDAGMVARWTVDQRKRLIGVLTEANKVKAPKVAKGTVPTPEVPTPDAPAVSPDLARMIAEAVAAQLAAITAPAA